MGPGDPTVYYPTVFASGPPLTKRKVQLGGFLQKNRSLRNELRMVLHYIKKRRDVFLFLASVLILLNLIYSLLLQSFSMRQTIKEFHSKLKYL